MSYTPTRARSLPAGRAGLGGVATTVSAATAIVTDPCLPEASRLILRLHELEQTPTKPGTKPPPPTAGIGLCGILKPLRTVVYVKERPWVLPVGAVAVVAGLVGIGYAIGRSR